MTTKQRVIQTIFEAVGEVNRMLSKEMQLEASVDTPLFGQSGKLDSLGLINLIVATEQALEKEYGVIINLADEKAMSQVNDIFKTVGTLANYLCRLLEVDEQ